MIRPSSSLALVFALNCLQNSMMLICACPSAGPTGGAGVALPAAICNFTEPVAFFAMSALLRRAQAPAVKLRNYRAQSQHYRGNQFLLYRISGQTQPFDAVSTNHFHFAGLSHNDDVRNRIAVCRHINNPKVTLQHSTLNCPERHATTWSNSQTFKARASNPAICSSGVNKRFQLFYRLGMRWVPDSQLRCKRTHGSAYVITFSTCPNPSSTGVERPKMVTITFSVSRSSLTSSTTPVKLANGPSVMRTDSFFSNLTLSFGFSLLSATR